jgi:hypothetical protein
MKIELVCPCGHPMSANDKSNLFKVVRRHVDQRHADLAYTDDQLIGLIDAESYAIG